MEQKADTLSSSLPMEKGTLPVRQGIPILTIGLAAVLVVVLVVLAGSAGKPAVLPLAGDAWLAANPELLVARHYTAAAVPEAGFLAANPELVVARRNTAPAMSDANFFAANPELMAARRYAAASASGTNQDAANPGPAEAPATSISSEAGGKPHRGKLREQARPRLKPGIREPHPRQPLD